jgi:transcriptional regulator with XRE-family HTH domain
MATKPWRAIQEAHSKRSAEERAATKARALRDLEIERLSLAQVRRARAMTQATIAQVMQIAQGDVSRLEHRTDAYIGTLRRYVEALGGTLRIVAEFPNTEPVEIEGFGALATRSASERYASEEPIRDELALSVDVVKPRKAASRPSASNDR